MKKVILAIITSICIVIPAQAQKRPEGVTYNVTVTRVLDGDTVAFEAKWLPAPLKPELSVRIYGVDTPEKGHRAQCPAENERGQAATKFTQSAVANSRNHQLILYGWDKYASRVLGDLILDGVSLREQLIKRGLAREYYGEAKTSWC